MTLNEFAVKYSEFSFSTRTQNEAIDELLSDVNSLLENLSKETDIDKLYQARNIINYFDIELQSKTLYNDKGNAKNIMDNFSNKILKIVGQLLDQQLKKEIEQDVKFIKKKLDELKN